MSLGKNIKSKLLDKSDMYNFYKHSYETYKTEYQNTINELTMKNNKNVAKTTDIHLEINNLKNKINNLEKKILVLNMENEPIDFIGKYINNKDNIFNTLKINNSRLITENKYLLNRINELQSKLEILLELNEKLISNKTYVTNNDLIDYYKKENKFFKKEYESSIKKQNEYELLFNKIFDTHLKELLERQIINDNALKEYKLHKINIAYVLSGFPTLSETFILNELRWLKYNNYNVKVFTYYNPQKPIDLDFDLEVIRFDGNLLENLEKLLIEHEIDLIHTHFVFPTGTNLTFPLAKKLKIPFTIFAHAYDIFIKENDKQNNISEMSKSEYCKGIFTLSNYHKDYLTKRDVPENKIILTRQATEYNISPLKQKNNKIKNIVSISRFVEKKGIETLIDAAKLLENENLNFSIYGFGVLEDELKQQISDLNLNNIAMKGSLNNPTQVKNIFNKSDLLVSPCKIASNGDRDGIPTVIFESMAYGVPVLTTNVSAIPEVIKDYENGFLIEPDDPYELKNKIKEIMEISPEEMFKIRKNAQKDVQNFSSIPKTMNTLLNTWSNIN